MTIKASTVARNAALYKEFDPKTWSFLLLHWLDVPSKHPAWYHIHDYMLTSGSDTMCDSWWTDQLTEEERRMLLLFASYALQDEGN